MDFYWWSEDVAEVVLSAALMLLPALVTIAASLRGMEWVVTAGGGVWRAVRALVDEKSDPLVVFLAERTGKTPEWIIEHGTKKIDMVLLKDDDA